MNSLKHHVIDTARIFLYIHLNHNVINKACIFLSIWQGVGLEPASTADSPSEALPFVGGNRRWARLGIGEAGGVG